MAHGRHRRNCRRTPSFTTLAAPVAVALTASVVGLGVASADTLAADLADATSGGDPATAPVLASSPEALAVPNRRGGTVSRAAIRRSQAQQQEALAARRAREATQRAIRRADTWLWTTAPLNLWTAAGADATRLGLVDQGTRVLVTGRHADGRVEIVRSGHARWVTRGYLSARKPAPASKGATAVARTATCSNGTSVPSGVSPNIVTVHAEVCAAFPEVTTYGTFRDGSADHAAGRAVDIMTSGSRGWQIAEFVRAHYADFHLDYVIYSQHIWSVQRATEGWRPMADRGSVTANHYDHVHVSVY